MAGASGVSELYKLLGIRPGLTAVIGSGGKTSLLRQLIKELPGQVILATSTHILPPAELPLFTEPLSALPADKVCLGTWSDRGKLCAPAQPWAALTTLADYVLVEADGSRQLPLKAHRDFEPVVPPEARQVIAVLGLSGLQRPIAEAAHCPELYARLCGAAVEDPATPERAAAVLRAEGGFDTLVLNQAEGREALGRALAAQLACPTVLASLRNGWWTKAE